MKEKQELGNMGEPVPSCSFKHHSGKLLGAPLLRRRQVGRLVATGSGFPGMCLPMHMVFPQRVQPSREARWAVLEREDISLKSCHVFSLISLMPDAFPMAASSLHPSISPCPQSPPLVSPSTLSSTRPLAPLPLQG